MYYVYIVECSDRTFYSGYTDNVERRIHTHNIGKGAKYTKSRLPVTLRYFEECETKSDALKREAAIKKLPRFQKAELIKEFEKGHEN
ncbi:MAG: GIY-YIG nuclease family protein [Clostridia bacterium]|nr:GIY-YIG nuclease family protein [Clostridia bacterium]